MESLLSRPIARYSLIAGVVLVGVLGFTWYRSGGKSMGPGVGALHYTHQGNPYPAPACTAFGKTGTSPKSLLFLQRAQELSHDNRYDEALAKYVNLATVDPTYPGVNLDISLTLSKLNRPDAARKAIESQMAASECVAQLPAADLDAYCKAEGYGSTPVCAKALGLIKQAAYYQAGLVETSLGRDAVGSPGGPPDNASMAPAGAPKVHTPVVSSALRGLERRRARREVTTAETDAVVVRPRTARAASGNALTTGAGTDAALGAYSK